MIAAMTIPKLDKALHLLVAMEETPMSSVRLAEKTGHGRATIVRLVTELRSLGCKIDAERDGADFSYYLRDWGVFDRARVRRYVKDHE